jgi:hypothetical protein
MKRINPVFPSDLDPEFRFAVYDTETWRELASGKRSVYLKGKSQVVYRDDNDNPMNDLFEEYKGKNVRRVWALTEYDVTVHDDYTHDKMEKIIIINGQNIQWNTDRNITNPMHIQPVCTVYENGNRHMCMGVNINGPSVCIYNPDRHTMGMSIWMETNAELELIR